jgi:MFS family permease
MQDSAHLLRTRRFLPIFVTQFLGAFNDNLFRTAMVMLVIYGIYRDAEQEATFSAIAGGLFIAPFFLLSALSGQLADAHDKAFIVRIVKTAEIFIMLAGAVGLLLHSIPLLLLALFAMGVHSTFFGPIKYAILPQHLEPGEVLGGTGLVEAGTYIAILGGTIFGGILVLQRPDGTYHAEWAALGVLLIAAIGRIAGGFVPPAPAVDDKEIPGFPRRGMDWHILRASVTLVKATMHIPRLFLAIMAISFFWAMGAVLAAQFPPLVKNALGSRTRWAPIRPSRPYSLPPSRSASRLARSRSIVC